jgi:hypothetical protein
MYFDLEGECDGINERTGDTLNVKFNPRSWSSNSYITGSAKDKSGKVKYEISGSWIDKIYVTNLQTRIKVCVWTRPPPIDNEKQQYGMRAISLLLNHLEN